MIANKIISESRETKEEVNGDSGFSISSCSPFFKLIFFTLICLEIGSNAGVIVYNSKRYKFVTSSAQIMPTNTLINMLPSKRCHIKSDALAQQPKKTSITNNPIKAKEI